MAELSRTASIFVEAVRTFSVPGPRDRQLWIFSLSTGNDVEESRHDEPKCSGRRLEHVMRYDQRSSLTWNDKKSKHTI